MVASLHYGIALKQVFSSSAFSGVTEGQTVGAVVSGCTGRWVQNNLIKDKAVFD